MRHQPRECRLVQTGQVPSSWRYTQPPWTAGTPWTAAPTHPADVPTCPSTHVCGAMSPPRSSFYLHRHISKPTGNHRKFEKPKRVFQIQSDLTPCEGPVKCTYTPALPLPQCSCLRDRLYHMDLPPTSQPIAPPLLNPLCKASCFSEACFLCMINPSISLVILTSIKTGRSSSSPAHRDRGCQLGPT